MPGYIDDNNPGYAQSAAEILRRHDNADPEANITSALPASWSLLAWSGQVTSSRRTDGPRAPARIVRWAAKTQAARGRCAATGWSRCQRNRETQPLQRLFGV